KRCAPPASNANSAGRELHVQGWQARDQGRLSQADRALTAKQGEAPLMPDKNLPFDGARVLADLTALRAIGAYRSGVHKPTFSEPHMRSLQWLTQRLPEAGLAGAIDGIGNVVGTSSKPGPKLLAGSHLESQNYAGWLDGPLGVIYALEAARVINSDPDINGA